MLPAVVPDFDAVDDVLPEDVTARAYGGEGREIGAGNPDGEGGVLLSQCLSGVLRLSEVSADVSPGGELDEAEHEGGEGDEEEERHGAVGMEDVLHRRPRHDEQRPAPEVIGEVLHAGDAAAQFRCGVLHDIGEHHRHDEDGEDAVQYRREGGEECHVGGLVDEGKADGHEECRDEVGEERERCHLLQVAANLLRHHRSRRRARRDDACQHRLGEDEEESVEVQTEDECHDEGDGEQLEHCHPHMPPHGSQFPVVHLTKRDEEDAEHEHRQDGIEERRHRRPRRVEAGDEGKDKVGGNAGEDAHRQRPVLDKTYHFFFHKRLQS